MDFLTDENIPRAAVKFLRLRKHNVKDIKEENLIGIEDSEILDIARKGNRILITRDKDFLNISLNHNIDHKGIVLLKLIDQSRKNFIDKIGKLLEIDEDKIKNSFIIMRENYIEINTKG